MDKKKLSVLESLLFAAGKALTFKELEGVLEIKNKDLAELIEVLQEKFNQADSGIQVAVNNDKIQFISHPDNVKVLRSYFKDELTGELTKPSLETLTIVAYRQPISKEELEQIRGVNCSLILRNLLIRGLVEENKDKNSLVATYSVTMDFLRHLGINTVAELPNFAKLNSNENLQQLLEENIAEDDKK